MKKYNSQLFWLGTLINIVKKTPLILIAAVLGIIGIWERPCLYFALGVMLIVLVWSFVQQLEIKHTVEHSDNPNFAPYKDAMMSDDWREEIKKLVEDENGKDQ